MKISDRLDAVKKNSLCLNCLSPAHIARFCTRGSCHHCGQRHHTLLHAGSSPIVIAQTKPQTEQTSFEKSEGQNPQPIRDQACPMPNSHSTHIQRTPRHNTDSPMNSATIASTAQSHTFATDTPSTSYHTAPSANVQHISNTVLLSTTVVSITDHFGNSILARALLDSGSQRCYMSENFSQKLKFRRCREHMPIVGVGGSRTTSTQAVFAKIYSRVTEYVTQLKFHVLPCVTVDLPVQSIDIGSWNIPNEIVLADPTFYESRAVDLIIGAEIYLDIIQEGRKVKLAESGLTLQNTQLGWIVSGPVPDESFCYSSIASHSSEKTETPADASSRGMTSEQLLDHQTRWEGPPRLHLEKKCWPKLAKYMNEEFDQSPLEQRATVSVQDQDVNNSFIFTLKSNLSGLVRIVALIRRFVHNCKNHQNRRIGFLTIQERESALLQLVALAQQESFYLELSELKTKGSVRSTSRISSLNPRLVDGILLVGGRLNNAQVSAGCKHPIILDNRHLLTTLVVAYYHETFLHDGQQHLISSIREKFWPIGARSVTRKVINRCLKCFRARPKVHEQLLGDLPAECVTPAPPFSSVGVYYCKPYNVNYPFRKVGPINWFIAVFVWLVILLEIAADLTTQTFIAPLKRFVAHRDRPEIIMCDNAKNFIGARRGLDGLRRPFSSDMIDLTILTPGHFLVNRPLMAIPEPSLEDVNESRLSKWQRVQNYLQQLWRRWSTQYLSNLHSHTRWTKQRNNLFVGTMVLLRNENSPPLKWSLGRLVEIHTGNDGNVRVVKVRTKDGVYVRAISKVCILPIADNESSYTED